MTTWITVCDTCKHDDWDAANGAQTDGEKLAELIEAANDGPVKIRRHSCLMGCDRACNITIQAEGKLCYSLGNFQATPDVAQAIIDYANLHDQSPSGQIPYRTWPQEIKGHFVSRHPPLPVSK